MAVVHTEKQVEALVTAEALMEMSDLGPCELIDGRIVYMSPTKRKHGKVEVRFGGLLDAFASEHTLGHVLGGEVGIFIRRNPDTIRAADVIFISNQRYAQLKDEDGFLDVAPELVVEVLSPSDSWSDVMQKLREYFSIGVRLVWVADPASRVVYAYRSLTDVSEFTETDALPGDDVLPSFSVPVAELFAD